MRVPQDIEMADRGEGVAVNKDAYMQVAASLRYIAENFETQPSLEDVAAEVKMSPHHFQRIFSQWVGISPKKFLQAVSLEEAKRRLQENESVLNAAFDAGLSGPGRLHDLFVTHEALTPGDYKALGRDLVIRYGLHVGPFGETIILLSDRGLCGLAFVDDRGRAACLKDMTDRFALSTLVQDQDATAEMMAHIFSAGGSSDPDQDAGQSGTPIRLLLKGTPFQVQVWQALMAIPPGALTTYGTIANALGKSGAASRAIGTAVGANPISWLIPCHRVIRNTGLLGGYRWGLPRKVAMLGWEGNGLPAADKGLPQSALSHTG